MNVLISIQLGDLVGFDYQNQWTVGEVENVSNRLGVAYVRVQGQPYLLAVALPDLGPPF